MGRILSEGISDAFGRNVEGLGPFADCIFIDCGGSKIPAHQAVISRCSPVLKEILSSLEVQVLNGIGGPGPPILLPDFQEASIRILLQFLYTGEIYLTKGSRTLVEFKELCNILRINPPVNKYRNT